MDEHQTLEQISAKLVEVEEHLKIATHAHGKVAATGQHKEFAVKCATLANQLEKMRKELSGKKEQVEAYIRGQNEYKELVKLESLIDSLCEQYL